MKLNVRRSLASVVKLIEKKSQSQLAHFIPTTAKRDGGKKRSLNFASLLAALGILAIAIAGSMWAVHIAHAANATATTLAPTATYYFHGTPQDQINKAQELADGSYRGTATFNQTAPSGSTPIVQTMQPVANHDFVGNSLAAYWRSPYSGPVNGDLELNWYWNTPNGVAAVSGVDVEVSVFADPDYVAARVQPQHLIGRAVVTLGAVTPVPTLFTNTIPVNGNIQGELLIQVTPAFADTGSGLLVLYDSVSSPSNFRFLNVDSTPTPTPTATPTPAATPTPDACSSAGFSVHMSPSGIADSWGEPSIGVNWNTERVFNGTPNGGTVMSYGGINVPNAVKITFDDTVPAAPVATWEEVPLLLPAITRPLGDPILFTDHETGRTFVSQLLGGTKQSTMEYTDDDGATFQSSVGSGINSGVDHQTIGGGAFAPPLTGNPNLPSYKNAVWYCAQDVADANCAVSNDGGTTFGPAVPIYTIADCAGLHGHVKVARDGTVYIPNRGCGGSLPYHENSKQAVVVSEDNGQTWQIRPVPSSTGNGNSSPSDPSVGIATDGTLYFGYQNNDGHARIAVSKDKGQTWINDRDVGAQLGIENSMFPAVVAGDPDRAAFAFFGTTTAGTNYDQDAFPGVWYLYIATTYDGGLTWTTVNATPGDPIQRGGICGGDPCRNLLDFFDATIDKQGRVLVGYDDGCINGCVQGGPNTRSAKNAIARQISGRRMFAAADSCGNPTPTPTPTSTPTPTATPTPTPTATPTPTPGPITPVYQKGGIDFSPSVPLRAAVAGRDGEPSLRVDKFGNAYVAGIRGVPAGVDLWYFNLKPGSPTYDPYMRNPIYRGQPDQFSPDESIELGADGGGDVDLAVGFDEPSPGTPPYLAFSSLTAANISAARSTDGGATFTKNPAGNVTGGLPGDDRQWMEFFGKDSVYLLYRTLDPAIAFVQRSNDGGLTYGPAREVGTVGQVGGIDVDQNDGTVYVAGANGVVAVGTPFAPGMEPLTYTIRTVGGGAHIFFTVKVANDGTVYVCYSDGKTVFIKYSRNKGLTWSAALRVSDGPETATSVLPWLETGPVAGSIGVVWYGTTAATNNDNANWKVFFAQSLNATSSAPVFRQVELSDHFIHGSNISEGGLPVVPGAAPNRNLLDYFQIGFDPMGAAVVAYTDDHNDFDGHVYVARQISGPSVNGANVLAPVEGSALPPRVTRSESDPQVFDYAQDSKTGLLTILPLNDPLDILSVRYTTEGTAGAPVLVATMKVSDLATVPPLSNWRMSFTANAPDSRLSPTGDYSFGLSDRGDQFFVRATTDAAGNRTFTYGTAVREHQHRGFIAYTDRGVADGGSFDSAAGTITVRVSLDKLNATLAAGHLRLGPGSLLVGLRGSTFTTGDDNPADRNDRAKSDMTRGGTQYEIEQPLEAMLGAGSTSGTSPLLVNFDGSRSRNPNPGQAIAAYIFDFGDGTIVTQSGPRISHTYTLPGTYNATLRVVSPRGSISSNTAQVRIVVNIRPPGLP